MCVLVSIKVRQTNAGRLDTPHLCRGFRFDFVGVQVSTKSRCGKAA
jgi:hypothetical protein